MKINIYYWNNSVGVFNDVTLIKTLLSDCNIILYDISKTNEYRKGDLGIHIQNVQVDQISNNKKNIFIINEEWLTEHEILQFKKFDYLMVKSNHAKQMLSSYHSNIIKIDFFSLDRYFFPKHTNKILHLKGKSIQKNTELIVNNTDIKILDSEKNYLPENELIYELNNHDIHICCSLYEAWGHYLWEAMSCGKLVICSEIPVFKEYLNPDLVKFIKTDRIVKFDKNYNFLNSNNYPFREGYFIDKNQFNTLLNDKEELLDFQNKNKDCIRDHFLQINHKNKQKFLNVVKCIL